MIIETNGLPGSGKTYFCSKLYENLKLQYNNISNMNYIEKNVSYKIMHKIISNIEFYFKNENEIYKALEKKYRYKNAKYANSITAKNYLKRLVYLKWFYKKNANKKKIYIFDEGIYQVVTALASDFDLNENEVENIIKDITTYKNCYSIFILIKVSYVIESINKRNRKECDIDMLDKEQLIEMLKRYEVLINGFVKTNKEVICIYRYDDIYENVNLIKNRIGV